MNLRQLEELRRPEGPDVHVGVEHAWAHVVEERSLFPVGEVGEVAAAAVSEHRQRHCERRDAGPRLAEAEDRSLHGAPPDGRRLVAREQPHLREDRQARGVEVAGRNVEALLDHRTAEGEDVKGAEDEVDPEIHRPAHG